MNFDDVWVISRVNNQGRRRNMVKNHFVLIFSEQCRKFGSNRSKLPQKLRKYRIFKEWWAKQLILSKVPEIFQKKTSLTKLYALGRLSGNRSVKLSVEYLSVASLLLNVSCYSRRSLAFLVIILIIFDGVRQIFCNFKVFRPLLACYRLPPWENVIFSACYVNIPCRLHSCEFVCAKMRLIYCNCHNETQTKRK